MEKNIISKKLFGGKIDFVIYNVSQRIAEKIGKSVYVEALRLQKIFNMYDPESELSKLNQSRRKNVSDELLMVLKKALEFSELTHGSYDVTFGKSTLLRKKRKIIIPSCSYKDVLIKNHEITLKHSEIMIDLGSIAKGYITDKLAEHLQKKGIKEFLIDARGDICVRGRHIHVLGIQDPRKQGDICSIKMQNQSVATSGDYKQYVKDFGRSHIINQKDAISITVVTPTLEEADAYATVLFTCSGRDQKKLLDANKNIKALIIEKGNKFKTFNDFDSLLYNGLE